jgi:hypothetical protein
MVFIFLISRSRASLDVPFTLAAAVGSAGCSDATTEPAVLMEDVGNVSVGDYSDVSGIACGEAGIAYLDRSVSSARLVFPQR